MEIELNGATYHVREHGAGDRTVILIHGWPDDGDLWRHQVAALVEAGYRVLAPDLLGFGKSERHPDTGRYTGARLAADLLLMMDRMDIARAHLVAHDWGAVVGWEMVASAPQRFASYAALSVGHSGALFDLDHGKLSNLWYFLLAQTELAPELFRASDGAFMRFFLAGHPQRDAIADRMVAEPDYLQAMRRIELAHPVAEILLAALTGQLPGPVPVTVPTLGLWGAQDELMWRPQIADSERFMEAEWQFEQVDEAGHWLMLDQPDRVTGLLMDWMEGHA
ncbi:alpha/beta fold hydrolase [Rhodophyticola porphyridii]|uniref:alpha/beta fold hydrolase n=1 Tax=Rhodophyticola porphyridii TaxID=1852017 RepID=UPI0035CF87B8